MATFNLLIQNPRVMEWHEEEEDEEEEVVALCGGTSWGSIKAACVSHFMMGRHADTMECFHDGTRLFPLPRSLLTLPKLIISKTRVTCRNEDTLCSQSVMETP